MASGDQPPVAFPDVESLVVSYLAARSELAGVPVRLVLPDDYDGKAPTVLVTRVGGVYVSDDRLDNALVRIDAYGPDKAAAHRLALTARGLLWVMPVADLAEERGPHWLPDTPHQHAARYMARYRLTVHV
ncbi:MAG: hypothetical protein ACJ73S_05055 [Mycobacteriales bacterium]